MNKQANNMKKPQFSASELRGLLLVCTGVAVFVFYCSWWFQYGHWRSISLLLAFLVAFTYGSIQIVGSWLLYLATHRRYFRPLWRNQAQSFTIDVFVTACGEELHLVDRALKAACDMNGDPKVWLLDDGDDVRLKRLAERLNIGYITRPGNKNAKAGNINYALDRTNGDIVVIFDIDHAPKANFLERTLGYFANPEIGFVQVMLTFENGDDKWVAQAASESSLDFYNPTSIGSDGVWSATLVGSNALIRREALNDIDGYKPGLAEDLATSIELHAADWLSVYVEEPLAPGLAPPDMTAWFTQQLKWARGVFELLLTSFLRFYPKLSRGQKLSYAVRMTYYWVGPFTALHMLITLLALYLPNKTFIAEYQIYLMHLAPLGIMTLIIRQLALRRWLHKSITKSVQIKPMALVFTTWPIYTVAWIMSVFRVPLKFKLTPKTAEGNLNLFWLLPQAATTILLFIGIVFTSITTGTQYLFVLGMATAFALPQLFLFFQEILMFRLYPKRRLANLRDKVYTSTD